MIIMKGNKYQVIDTQTKEVLEEFEFVEGDRKSIAKAKEDAIKANSEWKTSK